MWWGEKREVLFASARLSFLNTSARSDNTASLDAVSTRGFNSAPMIRNEGIRPRKVCDSGGVGTRPPQVACGGGQVLSGRAVRRVLC